MLSRVVGAEPMSRSDVAKRLWKYISDKKLQDQADKRRIHADKVLLPVFGGKKSVTMFEMTALVSKHLRLHEGEDAWEVEPSSQAAKVKAKGPRGKAPRRVNLSVPTEEQIARVLAKNSALDAKASRTARREQGLLRRFLFGGTNEATCAICGRTLPVGLLVAAHIKPRSRCTDSEKRRLRDNVMGACALGCDALFERGLLYVEDGVVRASLDDETTPALRRMLGQLKGRKCEAWSDGSSKYFAWHATNRKTRVVPV